MFGKNLRQVDKYVDILNKYYMSSDMNINKYFYRIAKFDRDELRIDEKNISLVIYIFSYFYKNFIELLKFKFKNRPFNLSSMKIVQLNISNNIFANLNNGTIVILKKKYVDKFYLKDVENYYLFYKELSKINRYNIKIFDSVLVIRMPRLNQITKRISHENSNFLNFVELELKKLNKSIDSSKIGVNFLELPYKLHQLAKFYSVQPSKISRYLELSIELNKQAMNYKVRICHGDLWNSNILRDNNNDYRMIDYDKSFIYCRNYDYIYFFFMEVENNLLQSLYYKKKNICITIDNLVEKYLCTSLPRQDKYEIILCILTILLIKVTEHDIRNLKIGASVNILQDVISSYIHGDANG